MGEIGCLEDISVPSGHFLQSAADLVLNFLEVAGNSFSSNGDGAISIFHRLSFSCKESRFVKTCVG